MDDYWIAVFWSLLPTVVVSAMFFFVLRSIIRADRTERREYARIEAEERARSAGCRRPPRRRLPSADLQPQLRWAHAAEAREGGQ